MIKQPIINFKLCKRAKDNNVCRLSADQKCPHNALVCGYESILFHSRLCIKCTFCVDHCPAKAIKIIDVENFILDPKEPKTKFKDDGT